MGFVLMKGGVPLYITNKITPAANKSACNPEYLPSYISGGLYPSVPTLE